MLAASRRPITFWLFDFDPGAHLEHYINYRQGYKSCIYGSETGKARTIVRKAQEICPRTMSGINANLGLKLLRLAPLVISSASLMCGIDQTTALEPFTRPELAKKYSGLVLPRWFPGFFNRTILVVTIAYPLAITTAYLNTVISQQSGVGALIARGISTVIDGGPLNATARSFYYVGMCFSAGHFLYGPYAMRIIARICNDEKPGDDNVVAAEEWLRMNTTRLVTVDFWGWLMYLCAVASAVNS